MAVKNFRRRAVALFSGLFLSVAVWAGLESGTYISDLVVTNPLGSDLASTIDDHIRLLKSTIKTTFPNINGAVTVTDEQINAVVASGVTGAANPTGTIGLTAVNGSATTYLRSDGAPALSQSIAPTWSGTHTFTANGFTDSTAAAVYSSTSPFTMFKETDAAANNGRWRLYASGEQLVGDVLNDAQNSAANWVTVDRTGTTVDIVNFPTQGNRSFIVGTANTSRNTLAQFRSTSPSGALDVITSSGVSAGVAAFRVHNENTAGDNNFVEFLTEATSGTLRGSIDYNRAGGLTRYNTTSDVRLKKNFRPAASARGVIDCIQIESYDWKESGNHVEHGVVAQRLNKCAPYAVSKGNVWQVDKSTLIPALIKYVQEQDARIARLEANATRRH